jgi:hypothetical protein
MKYPSYHFGTILYVLNSNWYSNQEPEMAYVVPYRKLVNNRIEDISDSPEVQNVYAYYFKYKAKTWLRKDNVFRDPEKAREKALKLKEEEDKLRRAHK